jgi:hypothetical protein
MMLRIMVYPLMETPFGEDDGFLILVENNRYFV